MPFRSLKQLIYLKKNHPEIYERWKRKYGTKIKGGKNKKDKK